MTATCMDFCPCNDSSTVVASFESQKDRAALELSAIMRTSVTRCFTRFARKFKISMVTKMLAAKNKPMLLAPIIIPSNFCRIDSLARNDPMLNLLRSIELIRVGR